MSKKEAILRRLGQNLRVAREAKGWSQEELALQCGVHRTYVGSVERGEYNVTILTLKKFTDALDISFAKAMTGLS